MIQKFSIEVDGIEYECEREVTGQRVLRQKVRVLSVGSKEDPASYQANSPRVSTMGSIARILANELVSAHKTQL